MGQRQVEIYWFYHGFFLAHFWSYKHVTFHVSHLYINSVISHKLTNCSLNLTNQHPSFKSGWNITAPLNVIHSTKLSAFARRVMPQLPIIVHFPFAVIKKAWFSINFKINSAHLKNTLALPDPLLLLPYVYKDQENTQHAGHINTGCKSNCFTPSDIVMQFLLNSLPVKENCTRGILPSNDSRIKT